ncbi:hypothetical protein [Anaerotalea alkaliphila]|uniref:Uncharacterized protein n=1 Tax=Anaerotalea alkaliphila TaxID=2662126 RepID=A0A7X5KN33_9FIRM|nr:hypothetical protein [Anaerotalea alkaliphila]NDL66377.1 hypothetical protein [Anaerotalea alkaliphila]
MERIYFLGEGSREKRDFLAYLQASGGAALEGVELSDIGELSELAFFGEGRGGRLERGEALLELGKVFLVSGMDREALEGTRELVRAWFDKTGQAPYLLLLDTSWGSRLGSRFAVRYLEKGSRQDCFMEVVSLEHREEDHRLRIEDGHEGTCRHRKLSRPYRKALEKVLELIRAETAEVRTQEGKGE